MWYVTIGPPKKHIYDKVYNQFVMSLCSLFNNYVVKSEERSVTFCYRANTNKANCTHSQYNGKCYATYAL